MLFVKDAVWKKHFRNEKRMLCRYRISIPYLMLCTLESSCRRVSEGRVSVRVLQKVAGKGMAENLFQGLPPPSATSASRSSVQHRQEQSLKLNVNKGNNNNARDSPPVPNPALKSALKRPNPPELNQEGMSCFISFLNPSNLSWSVLLSWSR